MRIRVRRNGLQRKDSGYMLLVLMLAVAVLMITMLGVARNYRRAIQRDREVEMIHRGEQYSRAVKRYYKKFGRYPTTIEQLENTNKIRFLRKKYKDPMSPDGEWKIAHATDIKLPGIGATGAVAGGAGGGAAGDTASAFSRTGGSLAQTNLPSASGGNIQTGQSTDETATTGTSSGTGTATQGTGTSSSDSGSTGPTGTGNATNQVLGGGDMLGVVSKVKTEGIHSFGDKKKYNEWFFIYVPAQDTGTALLTGPYNPKMFIGSANSGLGNTNKPATGSVFGSTGTSNPTTPTTTSPASPTTTP